MSLKVNKYIILIITIFFLFKVLFFNLYKIVWWDSAVYIGIGKYIYSLGNAGLWEPIRPVIWPLLLGFLWKVGFNVIIAGRILEIIIGSLCILFTYLVGGKIFNEKVSVLASILFAISPTFFFFNGVMLAEIVSTLFALIAVYLFLEEKYFLSGIIFGIALLTRYHQLIVFVSIMLFLVFYRKNKKKGMTKICVGFLIPVSIILVFNWILYNNPLYSFLQYVYTIRNSGWMNYQSINYYFIELLKENIFYLMSFIGAFLILRKKDTKKMPILLVFFLFFIFFNLLKQKEMRFLIILLPYMYLLMSYFIFFIVKKFKIRILKKLVFLLIFISLIFSIYGISIYYRGEMMKINSYETLQDKFNEKHINGKIWISNPVIPVYSPKKISKLMYYPVFDEEKKNDLIKESGDADFVFLDSCDLACKPSNTKCDKSKNELINYFRQKLNILYSSEIGDCKQYIFKKNI